MQNLVSCEQQATALCFVAYQTCPICFEYIDGILRHPYRLNADNCRHVYCECLPRNGNCPQCRRPFDRKIGICVHCKKDLEIYSYTCVNAACRGISCMKCVDLHNMCIFCGTEKFIPN